MAFLRQYYINPFNNKIIFISKQININTIKFYVKASHLQKFSPLHNSNIFNLISPITLIPKTQQNYLPIMFKNYSTMSEALHPAWVTGFVDAEGCFHVSITKKKELNVEWQVRLYFEIGLSSRDKALIVSDRLLSRPRNLLRRGGDPYPLAGGRKSWLITPPAGSPGPRVPGSP